mgnify:CR=1 FL=1
MRSSRHPGQRNHSHSTPFGVVVLSLPPNRRFPSVTSGYSCLSPSGTSAADHLHRRNGRALSGSPLQGGAVRGSEQGDVLLLEHGLRRAARRGLDNVRIQAYLTAAVMNLKKCAGAFCALWRAIGALLTPPNTLSEIIMPTFPAGAAA